jgi:hypothetical protein
MARSGTSFLLAYGYEATPFGGATLTRLFGTDQRISGLEFSNNQIPLPQLNTPEICSYAYGKNRGGCTIDYKLTNPFVLSSLFNFPVKTGSSPFTYVWTTNPVVNPNIRKVRSTHVEFWLDTNTGIDRNAKGVITPSWNIKTGIDQTVDISQTLEWGREDTINTSITSEITEPCDGFQPYSFANCSIKSPVSGGALAGVQNIDITFDTGQSLLYQVNLTPNANDLVNKVMNMTGKLTMTVLDKEMLQRVFNRAEIADMELKITNGLSAGNEKSITFLFTGVGLSRHGNPTIAPDEVVLQDIDFQCRRVTVTAVNNINDPDVVTP